MYETQKQEKLFYSDQPRPHVVMIAEPANHMSNIHKESVVAYAHQTVSPPRMNAFHDPRSTHAGTKVKPPKKAKSA